MSNIFSKLWDQSGLIPKFSTARDVNFIHFLLLIKVVILSKSYARHIR